MDLQRTPLLIETAVPTNWPKKVGYPPPGLVKTRGYPAGSSKKGAPGVPDSDGEYECTPEGKKLAKAQAWMFPSKRIKVCNKILKY